MAAIKKPKESSATKAWHWLKTSVWAFPLVLFIVLLLLTSLRISGTSTGTYYPRVYGSQAKDPNLLYGKPRAIRSDEWLVGTQMIIGQSKIGFPRVNQNMTSGQDLSLQPEVPIKDWSTIFKPHNWSFFVLPLEYAFAFKWWLVMYLMIIGCYFFVLRVLPGNRLFAIIFSVAIGLTPFELWWYQSGAFLTIAYAFFMAILLIRLINNEPLPAIKNQRVTAGIYTLLLAFLLSSFGLILYPPFQIAVALVLGFFTVGYILQKLVADRLDWRTLLRRLWPAVLSLFLAGLVGIAFIKTHRTPINAINASIYPGHRVVESGTLKLLNVFDAYVLPFTQSDFRGGHFITNQSEASNFILLLPFLLIPGLVLIVYEWKKKRRIDWVLLALEAGAVLLFVRVFTPYGGPLFKLMLLHRVPNRRLLIGIGFLGVIHMLYLIRAVRSVEMPPKLRNAWAVIYGLACFAVLFAISLYLKHHFPSFVLGSFKLVVLLALIFAAMITALLADKRLIFAGMFLLFTLGCGFRVIPLYRGLGISSLSQLTNTMAQISKPGDTWVTVGDDAGIYENFGILAGRRSISGTQVYPQLNFWEQAGGKQYEDIYNREGHVFFSDSEAMTEPFAPASTGSFRVHFECSDFIRKNVNFALAVRELKSPCVQLVDTVNYPAAKFFLYRVI